jgi:predicted GNAT family N-acyltransferase
MTPLNELIIEKVSWQTHKNPLQQLRHNVFVKEQHVSEKEEWDNNDETATHFLCLDKSSSGTTDEPIATARLLASGQIGRMAVAKKYRNLGLGTKLLNTLLSCDEAKKYKPLFLHAQLSAIPFYEKLGFTIKNDIEFEDAGIMHKTMEFHNG